MCCAVFHRRFFCVPVKMNITNDLVCNILETPFSRWKEDDKKDLLACGRPTPPLDVHLIRGIKKAGKSYTLRFKKIWYEKYNWLCGSVYKQRLFCWPCLLLGNKKLTWNFTGFCDFLNANRAFQNHTDCAEHIKCALQFKKLNRNLNASSDALKENSSLFITQFNENVRLNRQVLNVFIDAVLYLCKQELAFCGDDESGNSLNGGNFQELLTLLISKCPMDIKEHYKKIENIFTGELKTIQNEIMECISEYIHDFVKSEIVQANCFSIQVDDTTDVTQTSQCSIVVRLVNCDGELVERFLGFYDVSSSRNAQTLFDLVDRVLQPFNYKSKLVSQCYDGASVMSEHLNELQMKVKEEAPQAMFVHCLTQRLNLVLQQSFRNVPCCRVFFATLGGISSFFHQSAKRTYLLDTIVGKRMLSVGDENWLSNSKSIDVVVEEWASVKTVFQNIISDSESDNVAVRLANGFLHQMNDFEFAFLALVFNEIFKLTSFLYSMLQEKPLDINFCNSQIEHTCKLISELRNEEMFTNLFVAAKNRNEFCGPKYFNEQCDQTYKLMYYEILDRILLEMDSRFKDLMKLEFVCLGDTSKFDLFTTHFPQSALLSLGEHYPLLFSKLSRLKTELELIYQSDEYKNVSLQNVLQILRENDVHEDVFTEAYKLFTLILTIPSTSVSVERSYSCLGRLKTNLRNSMAQQRLSSLGYIAVNNDILRILSDKQALRLHGDILDKFAALKDRKINLVYKR